MQFNGYDFPVKFSSSNYWNDSPNNVKPEYGNHYHAYVYTNYVNNGTSLNFISQYVDEYVKYLITDHTDNPLLKELTKSIKFKKLWFKKLEFKKLQIVLIYINETRENNFIWFKFIFM